MSKAKAGTELQVNMPVLNSFAVIKASSEITDILRENLGGRALTPFDLDKVKFPSAGGIAWEIPTLDEPDVEKAIVGVIVYKRRGRVYYDTPFTGDVVSPTCSSEDGDTGVGDPGGSCATCPFAQFGSDSKGKGQACSQREILFIIREKDVLPLVVSVPPTSLKALTTYFRRLAMEGLRYSAVVSRLTLQKAKSGDGIEYSSLVVGIDKTPAGVNRTLNAEELAALSPTIESYRKAFNQIHVAEA